MSYAIRPRPIAPVGHLGAIEPDRMMGLIVTGTVVASALALGVWVFSRRGTRRNRRRRH